MRPCDVIQARMAEDGTAIVDTDADLRRHVEGCPECTEALNKLRELDAGLAETAGLDAPDALVNATLTAIRRSPRPGEAPTVRVRSRRRYLAAGLAASFVVLASLGLSFTLHQPFEPSAILGLDEDGFSATMGGGDFTLKDRPEMQFEAAPGPVGAGSKAQGKAGRPALLTAPEKEKKSVATPAMQRNFLPQRDVDTAPAAAAPAQPGNGRREAELDLLARLEGAQTQLESITSGSIGQRADNKGNVDDGRQSAAELAKSDRDPALPSTDVAAGKAVADGGRKNEAQDGQLEARPFADEARPLAEGVSPRRMIVAKDPSGFRGTATGNEGGQPVPASPPVGGLVSSLDEAEAPSADGAARAAALARNFLQSYGRMDVPTTRQATGYWANTYIPGDPAMRMLQARLDNWNRARLGLHGRLERAVSPVRQPFDGPRNAAMAVYLDSDAAAVTGPTRLRVQVGLKGAQRQGGHRPAMNIGLVVDLRQVPDAETGAGIRALISALEQARQPEDGFSLTVAGPAGGLLVAPAQFRHGPLRVAMERMFGTPRDAASAAMDLQQALVTAGNSVRARGDAQGVLGSSLLMLATASSLSRDVAALERMAHRNAVSGLALSVVSLGGKSDLKHIDTLVAAGQGQRRILDSAAVADALVDRELHSASRAVARALRLRIRLADGVELVDILGSRALGEPAAARVREAEQAIDQRLARSLGIRADRGSDEDGIQIVIPNFYAGDSHVILLDVLVQRAGPIADVTLRYKDVVYLRNATVRANLTIDDSRGASRALQGNVMKNLVAYEFARRARAASVVLANGRVDLAQARLGRLRDLLIGLRQVVPGWLNDSDLIADQTLLGEYLAVLNTPIASDAVQLPYLTSSLQYAAYRKFQSP